MDDKEFNEIMNNYAKSTSKGTEVDLVKLKTSNTGKKRSYKFVWAGVAAVLVIALICGIAIPLSLQTKEQGTNFYFSEGEYMENVNFDNLEELNDYGLNVMMPTIECIASGGILKKNNLNNEIGGALVELTVFDEDFDTINIIFFKSNYTFGGAQLYDICDRQITWNGIQIDYFKQQSDLSEDCVKYMVKFNAGNFNYYLDFTTYNDVELNIIMDMIYG